MKQFTNTSFGFSPNCYLSFHHKKIDNMCKGTHFLDSKKTLDLGTKVEMSRKHAGAISL